MKTLWQNIGIVAFWALLPALHIYLRIGRRTRVAVTHDKHLLVVKPWLGNGKWSLPGGGVHRSENPTQAVKRELFEETGVKADKLRLVQALRYRQSGLRFDYDLFLYKQYEHVSIRKQAWELVEAAWRPIDELSSKNSNHDVVSAKQWL